MKNFFLISTEHLEDGLWFRDDNDFIVGMNYVAIVAFFHPEILVYAFVLMSNHVHFVIYGTREDVLKFIQDYKSRYSMYYSKKYGTSELLLRNDVNIEEMDDDSESLEWMIAYVQMNAVAANICLHPSQYPWGTGNTFFLPVKPTGKRLDSMSDRKLRKILHTRNTSLPGKWILDENGVILPINYVPTKFVEKKFRSAKRMSFFLNNSSKAKIHLESKENLPSFRDQIVLSAVPDLCKSLFRKDSFDELSEEEQIEMMRQIRFRFSSDANQIARVCGMTYDNAAKMLDKK